MLETINEHIYGLGGDLYMPGGVHFPVRMTIVRMPDNRLWLHSPVAIDDAMAAEINKLGEVAWLVAPNLLHHLYFKKAAARWPSAKTYCSPGLESKRKDIVFDHVLNELPAEWGDAFDMLRVDGVPKINECVFLHKQSQTLVVTDLVFNIAEPRGWQSWLLLTMAGVKGRYGQSRVWRLFTKDRKAAGRTILQMLNWNFESVVMAHGAVVRSNAKQRTREGLHWMLRGL